MLYGSGFSWNEPTDRAGVIVTKHWSEVEGYFAVWAYDQLAIDRKQVKRDPYRRVSRITVVC
jgi:hypothetical protein